MKFVAIGVNYISADVGFREKLAIGAYEQKAALSSFYNEFDHECIILSTCNRVEIYSFGDINSDQLSKWLAKYSKVNLYELCKHSYNLQDAQVIEHLFRVVCGLDSMVLGEGEILGQAKKAYHYFIENGYVNKHLNKLFQTAFNLAKQARSETEIGKHSISIMSTTMFLIKKFFNQLNDKKIILVGSGKMVQLGVCYLAKEKPKELIVANRRVFKLDDFVQNSNAKAISLDEINNHLANTDILITSTEAPGFLISAPQLAEHLKNRNQDFLAIDLSVPRDIEINQLIENYPHFHSYNIDGLREVIQENFEIRVESAKQIEDFISSKVLEFNRWNEKQKIEKTLNQARKKQKRISTDLVGKAKKELAMGKNPEKIIEKLAYQISQKTLHTPLKKAKELAHNEHEIHLIRQIFNYD